MRTVNVYAAKAKLSSLLDQAEKGEEVVITRNGRPVAKIVPYRERKEPRQLGRLKGKIRIAADFDAPLPDDLLDELEGRVK